MLINSITKLKYQDTEKSMIQRNSIKDVAKKAGVCISTVSVALNNKVNKGQINQSTIERIQNIAAAMNYHPNSVAKSLRTGRSGLIGFLVEDVSNPFYAQMSSTLQHLADQLGYTLVITNFGKAGKNFQHRLKAFRERFFDAYIIAPVPEIETQLQMLIASGRPVIFFDRFITGLNADFVLANHFHAFQQATKHLASKGFSNIAFVTNTCQEQYFIDALAGYSQEMEIQKKRRYILGIPQANTNEAALTLNHFLCKNDEIDALIVPGSMVKTISDLETQKKGQFIRNKGFIAYNDALLLRHTIPSATVITQPIEEMCAQIMEKLDKKIIATDPSLTVPEILKVNPSLIEGLY